MRNRTRKLILYVFILAAFCLWCGQGMDAAASSIPDNQSETTPPPDSTPAPDSTADPTPAETPGTTEAPGEGIISFGSGSYQWNTGETCPIGIYAGSNTAIGSYEICLEYDASMLQYLDGAGEQDGNLLYIRGTGTDKAYKSMLHFEPLQSGNTEIKVVYAICNTVASNGTAAQEMPMSELPSAPIVIGNLVSNRVTDIRISPASLTFSEEVLYYELFVDADVEELMIEYSLEDEGAWAELSDTGLLPGENTITLTVWGSADVPVVYTFKVIRADPEEDINVISNSVEDPNPVDPEDPLEEEVSSVEEMEVRAVKAGLWIGVGVLLLLAVIALYVIYGEVRKGKKNREESDDHLLLLINLEETVIDVQNVTMRFKMAKEEVSSLKEFVIRTIKGKNHYRMLTALKDISFDVKQGDVVGIIGTNGSGKSTLLKIISGVLQPLEGRVVTDKNKIQILTLGTGFDMELTAKENVYLNGAIIGYTKEYINERYEDMVAFAELEEFMDERMKNFSSGMVSRLGFAIATMRDAPDILILDEVLSVGDLYFRQKSEKRIKELIHSGATVLIVSHSMDTIMKNCNKVVWIEKGILQMAGDPQEVCGAYAKACQYEWKMEEKHSMEEKGAGG